MSELKPCPFCGSEAKVEDHGSFKIVGCSKLSMLCPNPRMAVYNSNFSHWNTRTESTELEQLRNLVHNIQGMCIADSRREFKFDSKEVARMITNTTNMTYAQMAAKLNQKGE